MMMMKKKQQRQQQLKPQDRSDRPENRQTYDNNHWRLDRIYLSTSAAVNSRLWLADFP